MTPFAIDMRILAIDQIVSFERTATDDHRTAGINGLTVVQDPLPVTRIDASSFLLVDDQDRFTSLLASGLEQVPVQVCREDELSVACNALAVTGYSAEDLKLLAGRHPDELIIRPSRGPNDGLNRVDESLPPDGFVPVSARFDNAEKISLLVRHTPDEGFPVGMHLLFADIESRGQYRPLAENRFDAASLLRDPEIDGTIYLPPLRLSDLKMAARSQKQLPPDIIQVSYQNRILGVDFPVGVLASDISLEEKQNFLDDLIALRRLSRRTALIEGRVFILNR